MKNTNDGGRMIESGVTFIVRIVGEENMRWLLGVRGQRSRMSSGTNKHFAVVGVFHQRPVVCD